MKINIQTIKNIIKEELHFIMNEFKMPDIIPTPESMGFETFPSMESEAKQILSNLDMEGFANFLKKNLPLKILKESIEKNLPTRKRTASEIIAENVQLIKDDRVWQENFDQNIQELILISKEEPNQKELIDKWNKIFLAEKAKTWLDKNTPTIKSFVDNNYERLSTFIKNKSELALMGTSLFLVAVEIFWQMITNQSTIDPTLGFGFSMVLVYVYMMLGNLNKKE